MIILGLDISSKQLNGCLLRDDKPPRLCEGSLGKGVLIDRLRLVPTTLNGMIASVSTQYPDELVIEDAFGRSRTVDKALWGVIGALIAASAGYRQTRVTILRTLDWRRELGGPDTKDTKGVGHALVHDYFRRNPNDYPKAMQELNEHELDAIGIALAWKHRLENPV